MKIIATELPLGAPDTELVSVPNEKLIDIAEDYGIGQTDEIPNAHKLEQLLQRFRQQLIRPVMRTRRRELSATADVSDVITEL